MDQAADETRRTGQQLHLRQHALLELNLNLNRLSPRLWCQLGILSLVWFTFLSSQKPMGLPCMMGGVSITLEHFRICAFDGKALLPSESVQVAERRMLHMAETDDAPDLGRFGDKRFGFW